MGRKAFYEEIKGDFAPIEIKEWGEDTHNRHIDIQLDERVISLKPVQTRELRDALNRILAIWEEYD